MRADPSPAGGQPGVQITDEDLLAVSAWLSLTRWRDPLFAALPVAVLAVIVDGQRQQ